MRLRINDRVTWSSRAGVLNGTIVDIILDLNAAGAVVPWIDVKTERTTVRLCATDMNLIMMKVALVTEDSNLVERTNIMSGEKFMEPADRPYFCSPRSETYWTM
jgi:hypothetical protein